MTGSPSPRTEPAGRRGGRSASLVFLVMITVMLPWRPLFAEPGSIRVVSTSDEGVKGNGESSNPAMPADGSKLAFHTGSTNLDPADTDPLFDEYVKDLETGDITLISTSDTGVKANGESWFPVFSADGSKVAFRSGATNLDPADTDSRWDVYAKELATGDIQLGSTSDTGEKSNGSAFNPFLSGDGSILAFRSSATNLDPGDTDNKWDAYVKNLTTGDIRLVSTSDAGVKGNESSGNPGLTLDGSVVVFYSGATNLDPADTDEVPDIYVKDLTTGDLRLVSTSDEGIKGNDGSILPFILPDGSKVVFSSRATNLDPADPDDIQDIFLKNLITGETTLVSTSSTGEKANGDSGNPYPTADGSFLAFTSQATNLHPADTDPLEDVYLKDLRTGEVRLLSTTDDGVKGNGHSQNPALAADGTRVAFHSEATNLDPADGDAILDIYAKDLSSADLRLTMIDSPDPVQQGDPLTYSVKVTNRGPSRGTGTQLKDALPANVSFVSAEASQGSCSSTGRTIVCHLGSIAGGASARVEIVVLPERAGRITNSATTTGDELDPNLANNSESESTRVLR